MSRARGRRFEQEAKLNLKKVFAVIIAIVVIVMFVFIIQGILTKGEDKGKITSKSYFTVFKDNKWGVIDSDGETIISPSYEEMIIIPDNKKDVFLCTYNVNYETGEYKTKALNYQNNEIYTEYEQIEAIQNNDGNNNLWYEKNVLKVKKDGKYGLINLDGKQILNTEFEEITAISGIENSLKTKKDGKCGVVNTEGTSIIENKYADITNLGKDDKAGFIVKNDEGKYGVVNYTGTQVLESKYEAIEKIHSNDLYVILEEGKQKLINKEGNVVLQEGFDKIKTTLSNKDSGIIYEKDGKYGVMDLTGKTTVTADYENLTEAKNGIFIAKISGKYGIIDLNNTVKIEFKYNNASYSQKADLFILDDENATSTILNGNLETKLTGILNELNEEKGYIKIRVENEYKYYNFKFEEKQAKDVLVSNTMFLSKKDGKYGFVDKEGNTVVDYIYDDAKEQNTCGLAAVKKDGKWGSIDSKGNVVQEPTCNLDNYLEIDFIGRWHLGQDMNLNYYIQ
ncbi:MAG: WG repeat-containing protein [Clostridia bacterium]|nr:WG repeat-containing protein [Clostridia bacterium]